MAGMASTVERRTDTLTDTHKGRNEREGGHAGTDRGREGAKGVASPDDGLGMDPLYRTGGRLAGRPAGWQAGRGQSQSERARRHAGQTTRRRRRPPAWQWPWPWPRGKVALAVASASHGGTAHRTSRTTPCAPRPAHYASQTGRLALSTSLPRADDKSWPVILVALPTPSAPGTAGRWSAWGDGVREDDTRARQAACACEHEGGRRGWWQR